MSTSKAVVPIALALVVIPTSLLVFAFYWTNWDLDNASKIGDAAAPMVGVLSLLAVGAALWSVRVQESAIKEQRGAMADQLRLQDVALELQRQALDRQDAEFKRQAEALEKEIRYRRHVELREAYAPLLGAADAYGRAIKEYVAWMRGLGSTDDRQARAQRRRPISEALAELDRASQVMQLVDYDAHRRDLRADLIRMRDLEPRIDTRGWQLAYCDVNHYKWCELTVSIVALRDSLRAEFGHPPREDTEENRTLVATNLDEAKAMADAIEAEIGDLSL